MMDEKEAHNERIKMVYHGKDYEGKPISDNCENPTPDLCEECTSLSYDYDEDTGLKKNFWCLSFDKSLEDELFGRL